MAHLAEQVNVRISVLIADADRMSAHLIADRLTRGRQEISIVAVPTPLVKRFGRSKVTNPMSP